MSWKRIFRHFWRLFEIASMIHVFFLSSCRKAKGSMNPLFCQIRKFLWDIGDFFWKTAWLFVNMVYITFHTTCGEMAERLKAQHWKCCLGEILTRVRISLSPPFFCQKCGIAWMKWRQSHKSIFEQQKKWRRSPQGFTSLCRQAQLHSKNKVFSSHLHQTPEKTYLLVPP